MVLSMMNDDKQLEFIIEELEESCMSAITAHIAITLMKKQRAEIDQLQKQLNTVQQLYLRLKRSLK